MIGQLYLIKIETHDDTEFHVVHLFTIAKLQSTQEYLG